MIDKECRRKEEQMSARSAPNDETEGLFSMGTVFTSLC